MKEGNGPTGWPVLQPRATATPTHTRRQMYAKTSLDTSRLQPYMERLTVREEQSGAWEVHAGGRGEEALWRMTTSILYFKQV
jgi:hypothetical protein